MRDAYAIYLTLRARVLYNIGMKTRKKFFILLTLAFILLLTLFACGEKAVVGVGGGGVDPTQNPAFLTAPVLNRSDFKVNQGFGVNDELIAYLSCSKDPSNLYNNISEFEVFIDGEKRDGSQSVYLHGLANDVKHVVLVTAVGHLNVNGVKLRSETVKFEVTVTKLTAPTNLRMSLNAEAIDGKIVWDGKSDCYIDVLYKGVDFTYVEGASANTWFDTGRRTVTRSYASEGYGYSTQSIREVYRTKDFNADFDVREFDYFNELSISVYPEFANFKSIGNEGDVFQLYMPSDFSETSVKVLGTAMSQPENLRWDETEYGKFTFDPIYGTQYSYIMRRDNFAGGGYRVFDNGKGAGVGYIQLYGAESGNYSFGIESQNLKIGFMSPNIYQIYYSTFDFDTCEKLTYEVVKTKLQTPKNVRIEDDKLVWDAVENVSAIENTTSYSVEFSTYGRSTIGGKTELLLSELAEAVYALYENNGGFTTKPTVQAWARPDEMSIKESGDALFKIFEWSERSNPNASPTIFIKSIPLVTNVAVDYELKTVTWDEVEGAEGYTVAFYSSHGGVGTRVPSGFYSFDGDTNANNMIETNSLERIEVAALFTPTYTVSGQTVSITVGSCFVYYV